MLFRAFALKMALYPFKIYIPNWPIVKLNKIFKKKIKRKFITFQPTLHNYIKSFIDKSVIELKL